MKVLLRADASPTQGTGHVMRCLTLAEELILRSHEVLLLTNESGVDWLESIILDASITVVRTTQHSMDFDEILGLSPDWVITDSYEIDADEISALRPGCHVLAIVDGDDRGIEADLYVDHNLGAEDGPWRKSTKDRLLAGNEFALIRDAILCQRREKPWEMKGRIPHLVAFMGGSDPTGTIVLVAGALARIDETFTTTLIVPPARRQEVEFVIAGFPNFQVATPTTELPVLLGAADIAISACGTSAWELCTLGTPSLLLAVVDNQRESLHHLVENELVTGLDLTLEVSEGEAVGAIVERVTSLLTDRAKRENLSRRCLLSYDGLGKERVVAALEAIGAP
ncbi:UDP-2,4-diacetamido-2,4,6-trideoxy-beta-L-altropyranose hydrolase [Alpinimonas psychrophila]|uniref:UDP-2,4-diacetamido-2,4, 6-trideoxy-beta-L-altropyranose hydrolase n=1 Tax=Alpinimonas psychrophila TaxID=748908 RepID=A0A7W3JU26_9MICO|nr:UDP-2,4-diacetamido-2,4,6-trideoxy-beta-L-altropyranose hydrolase [Alpinimonas psychrophila]MBA8829269.1 UDP-2,4-diacetamido-2,4,6-trideoxy-beta-L-altropyranose hydrolase [Alpinimonas psychrophila]